MLTFNRFHTKEGESPFDTVSWKKTTAEIGDVFKQENVEFPDFYSQTAINIISQKYFYGKIGSQGREYSMKQLISRVVNTTVQWGIEQHYFNNEVANIFRDELTYMLLYQMVSFNSPVWFNLGNPYTKDQISACFINELFDNMESIEELNTTEMEIFRSGSGAGVNNSRLRSSRESLSGGGLASGVCSFMRIRDQVASVTKSGGKSRRAAKMEILDMDHGDIVEFIKQKSEEEKKALVLIENGYSARYDDSDGAYGSVFFQNSNQSVSAADIFMQAVEDGDLWSLIERRPIEEELEDDSIFLESRIQGNIYLFGGTAGKYLKVNNRFYKIIEEIPATKLYELICLETWTIGDPGIQFRDIINRWNTCANTEEIRASNPCSEYLFLDDTSCNLASFNLSKYYSRTKREVLLSWLGHGVSIMITAMDIFINKAYYPLEKIGEKTRLYRTLGLGYANLGGLLMKNGMAYDSKEARDFAAAITAFIQSKSFEQSAILASHLSPFIKFEENKSSVLRVMRMHVNEMEKLYSMETLDPYSKSIIYGSRDLMYKNIERCKETGIRNAQLTVLAPTGTISFAMDCDTSGIEPMIFLKSFKKLAGGGELEISPKSIEEGLMKIGYARSDLRDILEYIKINDTIIGAPHLKEEEYKIFETAAGNENTISIDGHLKMMAAVQPFLSGGISKTVNLPNSATVEDIKDTYMKAWKLGLKAVAIYRDGCKGSQPLNSSSETKFENPTEKNKNNLVRVRMKDTSKSIRHKFNVGGYDGYLHVGLYDDGTIGEFFVTISKEGSTIRGLIDLWAQAVSISIQHGVPLDIFLEKAKETNFSPNGFTSSQTIRSASSIADYIARWIEGKFRNDNDSENSDSKEKNNKTIEVLNKTNYDGPPCLMCGGLTRRSGTCYVCSECGETTGCG